MNNLLKDRLLTEGYVGQAVKIPPLAAKEMIAAYYARRDQGLEYRLGSGAIVFERVASFSHTSGSGILVDASYHLDGLAVFGYQNSIIVCHYEPPQAYSISPFPMNDYLTLKVSGGQGAYEDELVLSLMQKWFFLPVLERVKQAVIMKERGSSVLFIPRITAA